MATYEEDLLAMAQAIIAAGGGSTDGLSFNEAMKAMAAQVIVNGLGGGGGGDGLIMPPQPVGSFRQLTKGDGAGGLPMQANGEEWAVGLWLPAMSIDRIGIEVPAAGTAASTFRIGLRPIDLATGAIGAPEVQSSHALDSTGAKVTTVSATLTGGAYALCWAKIGDTGGAGRVIGANIGNTPPIAALFNLGAGTNFPATGHNVIIAQLNTGVAGALPSTVVQANQNTNSPGDVPMVALRRA
jgi:hypothetical protein